MPTLWNEPARGALVTRAERLTPDPPSRWPRERRARHRSASRSASAEEQRAFRDLLARIAVLPAKGPWPSRPAFGTMSRRSWGVLAYRHVDHHFTQFGV